MKKMKRISALVLACIMALSIASCGSNSANKDTSGKKVYEFATDTTFAPFEFEDSTGKFVGIDMELIEAIAKDQGFEYKMTPLGFNAAVQALESKQVDGVIAGMSITDERKKKFDFTEPYFDSGVVMCVSKNNNDIKSYDDLKGKKVAIKTGTEGATFANSIKDKYGFTTVVFDESANMFEDVKIGNSVACFDDYPVVGYAISKGLELKMASEKEKGSSYGIAVSKGQNTELLEKLNKGLANLKKNGTYDKILAKYITAK